MEESEAIRQLVCDSISPLTSPVDEQARIPFIGIMPCHDHTYRVWVTALTRASERFRAIALMVLDKWAPNPYQLRRSIEEKLRSLEEQPVAAVAVPELDAAIESVLDVLRINYADKFGLFAYERGAGQFVVHTISADMKATESVYDRVYELLRLPQPLQELESDEEL